MASVCRAAPGFDITLEKSQLPRAPPIEPVAVHSDRKWAELTDDDMLAIEGKKDNLLGKIQERYGYHKEQAEKDVKCFMDDNNCGCE
jgi:uncharacterized protein YjbJ (UPF0337 family)